MTLTVRPAVEADVDAIRAVGVATWPATYEAVAGREYVAQGLERWWSAEAVRDSIGRGGVFVAALDGVVVGMASVGERDGAPYLWKLYILPDRQGLGAGSALLDAVIASLPDDSMRLGLDYVDGNERAAAFYRARGFRVTGRTPSPLGVGPDEILMELPLAGRRPQRTP